MSEKEITITPNKLKEAFLKVADKFGYTEEDLKEDEIKYLEEVLFGENE